MVRGKGEVPDVARMPGRKNAGGNCVSPSRRAAGMETGDCNRRRTRPRKGNSPTCAVSLRFG